MKNNLLIRLLLSVSAILSCGCQMFKADPLPPSGFNKDTHAMTEQHERFPFNRVWVSPELTANREHYTKVFVAPVNTDYLGKMDWLDKQNTKSDAQLKKDVEEIAQYTQAAFVKAFGDDPHHRLQVVSAAGPDTLVLEMAIVKLVPSKAWFNAAATAAGFVVPGAGLLDAAGKGDVAIEARIRDGATGTVLATMADNESAQTALVNIAELTWYDTAKDSINGWSKEMVQLINSPVTEKVSGQSPFALFTW